MYYFVFIDGILGIKTNFKDFCWSYGSVAPMSSEEEFNHCRIKIFLDVRNSEQIFDSDINTKEYIRYHYFFAKYGEQKIYFERNIFGKAKLRYSIEIKENRIHVIVNKNYMKYIKYRIMGLHSMSYILTDIVSVLLLKNDFITLYCAAVCKDDQVIMVFSPPNTGKTLTSIQLCEKYGYKFLSEDLTLSDGEYVWSIPWTSTFRYYSTQSKSKKDLIAEKATAYFPFLKFLIPSKKKSILEYFGVEKIQSKAKMSNIVLLESGKPGIDFNKKNGFFKVQNLQRYLFYFHKSPTLIAMSYFNPYFSPDTIYEKEKELLSKIFERSTYLSVSEENVLKYPEKIHKIIGEKIGYAEKDAERRTAEVKYETIV